MGQKVSPISLRISINRGWGSRWFGGRKYVPYLKEDVAIRELLAKKLKNMGIDKVEIERGSDSCNVSIFTARPGLLIGRGGGGVEELRKSIHTVLKKKIPVRVEIHEVKNPETSASVMAESIVDQVEKRIPFRRAMKQTLIKIIASKNVKGAKIRMSGRLDGAEIARSEHLEEGNLPLQTLRANIDYARATAHTTYGTVGIKVWIYKGEVFEE